MTTLRIQLTPAEHFEGTLLHKYQWPRQLGFASGIAFPDMRSIDDFRRLLRAKIAETPGAYNAAVAA